MRHVRGVGDVVNIGGRIVGIPNHPRILRMVDKRVAIALVAIHRIVTVNLLLTHGVVVAPAKEHGKCPRFNNGFVRHPTASPTAVLTVIAHTHIEIAAGEVAFVFVNGFENRP